MLSIPLLNNNDVEQDQSTLIHPLYFDYFERNQVFLNNPAFLLKNSVFLRFSVFLRNSVFCTFNLVGADVNSRETLGEDVIDKVKLGSSKGIGEKLGFSEIVTF